MVSRISKAVIPAAGLGTRFLPATKSIPKEMLPVVDRPAIQYVVEEAASANLRDVLMITGRHKTALENHFDRQAELEDRLAQLGKHDLLESVDKPTTLADVHYLRQGDPLGLGHAVLRAKQHVGRQSFAVLLGDDLIDDGGALLRRMIQVHEITGSAVVALREVPTESLSSYGVVAPAEGGINGDVVRVAGLVEKPSPDDAPSNYAIIGRYVLGANVFDKLEQTEPGRGGEIQLTDALEALVEDEAATGGVVGVIHSGRRFDTGNKLDYIKAVIELATERDDMRDELVPWLREFASTLDA